MSFYYFSVSMVTTPSVPPVVPNAECGRVLSSVPTSVVQAPEGWVLCQLTDPEPDLAETKCEDLLVGLRGQLNAVGLLGSGKDHVTRDIMTQTFKNNVIIHHDMDVLTCHNPPQI